MKFTRTKEDPLSNIQIAEVPYDVKCFFGERGCDRGDIDAWTLIYGLLYFLIGLWVPRRYLLVTAIAVTYEVVKPILGNQPKYIINPLVAITAYTIGSLLGTRRNRYREKYRVFVN